MKKSKEILGKGLSVIVIVIVIVSLLSSNFACKSMQEKGSRKYKIIKIIDGDTYQLDNKEKIRLIGVNTPEIHHPTKGTEYFGQEADEFAKGLLLNKKVTLKYDISQRDKYGRLLAYVYLSDGTLVNALLVQEGYAEIMTVPPNVKFADLFLKLEREARKKKLGLWAVTSEKNIIIKGNINRRGEKIYHLPGGRYFQQTKAERIFRSEEEARNAGFRRSKE